MWDRNRKTPTAYNLRLKANNDRISKSCQDVLHEEKATSGPQTMAWWMIFVHKASHSERSPAFQYYLPTRGSAASDRRARYSQYRICQSCFGSVGNPILVKAVQKLRKLFLIAGKTSYAVRPLGDMCRRIPPHLLQTSDRHRWQRVVPPCGRLTMIRRLPGRIRKEKLRSERAVWCGYARLLK